MLVVIMSLQNIPHSELNDTVIEHSSIASKSNGVDLSVSAISYSYPNSVDRQKYQMFSSNYPVPNFNKPESLFITDAVIDVPITIQVTLQNLGTVNSPSVNLTVVTLHNEYQNFELSNQTNVISSVRALDSTTSSFALVPTYSGNHTIIVTPKMTTPDDNPSNDILTETFTVASHYFNCDNLSLWTVGQEWGTSTETALSQGSACHIGNGQSSTYQPNLITSLITPVLDMSDAIPNPTRTNGIGFFATGSIGSGDFLNIYSMSQSNSWYELANITGTIDSDISDGGDWQTASINNAGATSPLIPSPQQNFHANSQFRFGFSSDGVNQDIGLWIDEIVLIYDQQLRVDEYGI
ncbi:MAG: CARDB domain-containing protein, partial [Candidatus Thermoplasmatota archaeon]|nr:CARDB domain-containing protein [Candidatus Thermoplasmatota archaeon]